VTSAGCLVNAFILSSPARLHSIYKQSDGLRNRPSYKVTKLKKVFARQDLTCGGNECCTKGESQSGEMQVGPGQNSPCYHNFIGLVRGDGNVQMHGSVTAVAVWPTLTRPLHTSLFVYAVSLSLSLSLCVCVCVCVYASISLESHFIYSPFFTARCYASAVLAMALCPSVRLSVTSRCSTKTAKRRITQTTPHDSPGTLVF